MLLAPIFLATAITLGPPPFSCSRPNSVFFFWESSDSTCHTSLPDPCAVDVPVRFEAVAASALEPLCMPLNYEWDFGDGERGVGVSVTHVYHSTGLRDVLLTVSSARDTLSIGEVIGIGVPARPYPTFETTTEGSVVAFTMRGHGQHYPARWNLDFGDGIWWSEYTADPSRVVHTYRKPGNYRVTLTWSESFDEFTQVIAVPLTPRSRAVRH